MNSPADQAHFVRSAIPAGGLFADQTFHDRVTTALRERGFAPATLAFRPVDGLVRALADEARGRR